MTSASTRLRRKRSAWAVARERKLTPSGCSTLRAVRREEGDQAVRRRLAALRATGHHDRDGGILRVRDRPRDGAELGPRAWRLEPARSRARACGTRGPPRRRTRGMPNVRPPYRFGRPSGSRKSTSCSSRIQSSSRSSSAWRKPAAANSGVQTESITREVRRHALGHGMGEHLVERFGRGTVRMLTCDVPVRRVADHVAPTGLPPGRRRGPRAGRVGGSASAG